MLNNIQSNFKLTTTKGTYKITLTRDGKTLEVTDFTFGTGEPNIGDVVSFIGLEYRLYEASPTLQDYIDNRGMIEDIQDCYDNLKEYAREYKEFFLKEELEILAAWWDQPEEEAIVADEICEHIKRFYNKPDITACECAEIRENSCSTWSSYEELQEYLNQDDNLTIDEVKGMNNVKCLGNGLIIYL